MQFKHVLGPESLKTSKVGGPEPSSSYGIAGDPTGPGSQNFFVAPSATSIPVNALAEPHIRQYPRHSSGLGLWPPSRRLLLAAVSRYPALAAALPHRGRSLAFLGEPSLPFGALTGGSLFSRPKERCPRRVTPSSCRPFVPFLSIFVSSGRAAPPVVCVGVSPGPLGRPLAGAPPFVGRLPPPHGSAGCFHAVRICRRFWWPALACW